MKPDKIRKRNTQPAECLKSAFSGCQAVSYLFSIIRFRQKPNAASRYGKVITDPAGRDSGDYLQPALPVNAISL